jgi:hypothetical protein
MRSIMPVVPSLCAGVFVGAAASSYGGQAPASASDVALTAPRAVVEVDLGKLKGQPAVVAWSPDASEIYLQAVDRDRRGAVTSAKHYVVNVAAKSIKGVDDEPAWASKYWTWKSAQASPALATFKINIEERNETRRAVASPVGGDLAKGGTTTGDRSNIGSTATDAAAAAYGAQEQHIYALKTGGQTIGEWADEPVTPGTNFGWAPAPVRLLAFAKRDGGPLVVLDDQGHKREFDETKPASLPAFSDDATKICWLQRKGRNKFDLMIADIAAHR